MIKICEFKIFQIQAIYIKYLLQLNERTFIIIVKLKKQKQNVHPA